MARRSLNRARPLVPKAGVTLDPKRRYKYGGCIKKKSN